MSTIRSCTLPMYTLLCLLEEQRRFAPSESMRCCKPKNRFSSCKLSTDKFSRKEMNTMTSCAQIKRRAIEQTMQREYVSVETNPAKDRKVLEREDLGLRETFLKFLAIPLQVE